MTATSFTDPAMHEERRRHTMLGRWGNPDDHGRRGHFSGLACLGLYDRPGDCSSTAAGPRRASRSAQVTSRDSTGRLERIGFMQGRLSAHGRRQDPGVSVERMARGISARQGARPDPDGMDHRSGSAARKSADHRQPAAARSSRLSRGNAVANSEPDRRLLHAGAVLESGRRDARRRWSPISIWCSPPARRSASNSS